MADGLLAADGDRRQRMDGQVQGHDGVAAVGGGEGMGEVVAGLGDVEMLVPGEGLAGDGGGVSGGGHLHGDGRGGRGGAAGCGLGDGDGVLAVHALGRVADDGVLFGGGEVVRTCPGEGHAGGPGGGGELYIAAEARGDGVGGGRDGAADGADAGRGSAGASELVGDGDGVVTGAEAGEGGIALEGPAVECVGVAAADGRGDGDGTVGLEAGGVVGDGECRDVRCWVDVDGELGRIGTAVFIGNRNGISSCTIHNNRL